MTRYDDARRDEICRAGEEAFDRIKEHRDWDSYMQMGEAFLCGRDEAFIESRTNDIQSPVYKKAFKAWLGRYPKLAGFDASDRAKLYAVMENRGAIETWRGTLTWKQRSLLNHPTAVLRKWQAKTQLPLTGKEPKESPVAKLKQQIVELQRQHELDEERIAASADGNACDFRKDSIENIAKTVIGATVGTERAVKIARKILELVKETTKAKTPKVSS